MRVELKTHDTYTPDWYTNHETPQEEQVTVDFKYPTTQMWVSFLLASEKKTQEDFYKYIFESCVSRINNLTATVDGVEEEVTDPSRVMELPEMYPLFKDVAIYIVSQSALSGDDKKK